MTRAPPRRLRIAPMPEDSRCDCIEKLSFLFLRDERLLRLPSGDEFIRLPCFGSGESIATNHQKCRCHVSHFWGERHSMRRAVVARKVFMSDGPFLQQSLSCLYCNVWLHILKASFLWSGTHVIASELYWIFSITRNSFRFLMLVELLGLFISGCKYSCMGV
jgi:hypothetical protein